MQSILASLQAHKNDIKEADYDKLRSVAKDLGKTLTQRRKSEDKVEAEPAMAEETKVESSSSESEIEIGEEAREQAERKVDSFDMELAAMKREAKQVVEVDSDDEVKQRELH